MRGFWSVYRKELYSLFASPIFYVVAFTFLVISGYFFYSAMAYFNLLSFQASQDPMVAEQLNLTDMVLRPFFLDISIVLLLISPLLTMRLYAEERKTGTLELLFTYPLTDRATLLAKFAAVLSVFAVVLSGTLPGILLMYIGHPSWAASSAVIWGSSSGGVLSFPGSFHLFTHTKSNYRGCAVLRCLVDVLGDWLGEILLGPTGRSGRISVRHQPL